jgi:hypothetical protein
MNVPYAAHAFLVASGAGSAAGGSGAVTVTVTGTKIDDAGTRTPAYTETLVDDITALSANEYVEGSKFIGQVTYTLEVGATGHTTYSLDFNYGFCKYEDFGNRNFTLTDFEVVGIAGANDAGVDIELLHHKTAGWTYHATAFVAGTTPITDFVTVNSTESDLDSGLPFAFKRAGLATPIAGAASEGTLVRLTTAVNNAVENATVHIGARV